MINSNLPGKTRFIKFTDIKDIIDNTQEKQQSRSTLFPMHHKKKRWGTINQYENTPIQIYRTFHLQKLKISDKKTPILFIFLQKYRLWVLMFGSNEYPQSMFLGRNKKNNVYPCLPQFYYTKVGFKGVKYYIWCFLVMDT